MLIIGHRGARKEAPENTLAGFIHAQQVGCKAFELDVRLSCDHELMVIHDPTLTRTTGLRESVKNLSAAEMSHLDARKNTAPWPEPCSIPTLQEIVDAAPDCQHWQFEVKTDSQFRLSVMALKLHHFIAQNGLAEIAIVTSSDRWFLQHLKKRFPQIRTGYVAEFVLPDPVSTALALNCSLLVVNKALVQKKLVATAQRAKLHVSVWTVNDGAQMQEMKKLGVDSLITDKPSLAFALRL